MKKILGIILVLTLLLTITSCGNMSLGLGNFTFRHVHFTDMLSGYCATVEKWHDNEQGIEVVTTEYGAMFLSEGSYILFENTAQCPYCH